MFATYPIQSKAQEARAAIERLYIEMRHIFNRGAYKPNGLSGRVIREALLTLSPEIYGSLNDTQKVELNGLVYVMDRLPKGIEECRFIKFTSEEGFQQSDFEVIVPPKRRRNCYRVDEETMVIEVTRGRSDLYDVLTHLTFLYHEATKICRNAFDEEGQPRREWLELERLLSHHQELEERFKDSAFAHLSNLLGRTFAETKQAYQRFEENALDNNGLFHLVYWLGKRAQQELFFEEGREIFFSPALRERIGRHIYGEKWASDIKTALLQKQLLQRPAHIISANLHSVMNILFARPALAEVFPEGKSIYELALLLREPQNEALQTRVRKFAEAHGMWSLPDQSGTNLNVQIFDTSLLPFAQLAPELQLHEDYLKKDKPVLIVMDYAFGEQAYETMDELLKPLKTEGREWPMPIVSISVMGKAGILDGDKGDIMIPTAHVFEGTADNYPFDNAFAKADFENEGLKVFEGTMITVLGTSLQNRDVLDYFRASSWKAIGLEMEGAHYQKAIQAEALIRRSIRKDVVIRYAYYASDNPLVTGSTLASGSLGEIGVRPTYLITLKILNQIFQSSQKMIFPASEQRIPEKNQH
ncbi:MAG: hypothetical protein OHK0053_31120 [Microscillaceae bacterium]